MISRTTVSGDKSEGWECVAACVHCTDCTDYWLCDNTELNFFIDKTLVYPVYFVVSLPLFFLPNCGLSGVRVWLLNICYSDNICTNSQTSPQGRPWDLCLWLVVYPQVLIFPWECWQVHHTSFIRRGSARIVQRPLKTWFSKCNF